MRELMKGVNCRDISLHFMGEQWIKRAVTVKHMEERRVSMFAPSAMSSINRFYIEIYHIKKFKVLGWIEALNFRKPYVLFATINWKRFYKMVEWDFWIRSLTMQFPESRYFHLCEITGIKKGFKRSGTSVDGIYAIKIKLNLTELNFKLILLGKWKA